MVLYGTIGSYEGSFDAAGQINAVTWTFSNDSLAEITSFAMKGKSFASDDSYIWSLTVKALKAGTVTLTGTTENGTTASYTLIIEPEITVEVPDYIYRSGNGADDQIITCTVTLPYEDEKYLIAFKEAVSQYFLSKLKQPFQLKMKVRQVQPQK